jgi:hypothetical protein
MKARITLDYDVPLAARNGAIKVASIKPCQLDLKSAWDGDFITKVPHHIRGPIFCHDCGTEHHYIDGDKNGLRMGDTAEAREADAKMRAAIADGSIMGEDE